MTGNGRVPGCVVVLLAAATAAGAADLSGSWSLAGKDGPGGSARRGRAAFSLAIDQQGDTVTLGFGRDRRAAVTLRTDGAPRALNVNGNPTRATVAARWEGDALVVELTPARAGLKPLRSVWRRVDDDTLRIEGGLPGAGGQRASRNLVLTRQPGDGQPVAGGDQ